MDISSPMEHTIKNIDNTIDITTSNKNLISLNTSTTLPSSYDNNKNNAYSSVTVGSNVTADRNVTVCSNNDTMDSNNEPEEEGYVRNYVHRSNMDLLLNKWGGVIGLMGTKDDFWYVGKVNYDRFMNELVRTGIVVKQYVPKKKVVFKDVYVSEAA